MIMNEAERVDVSLRVMRIEDLEPVHAIDVLSFTLPWSERSYRYEVTQNPFARIWVAEITLPDGQPRVIGVIVVWLVIDEAHVATLAIHPDYRRLGIGRRLLAKALLDALERGSRQAYLEVRRSNLAAQALYRHFGFEETGVRPRYYQDNQEDAILMTASPLDRELLDRLSSYPANQEDRSAG